MHSLISIVASFPPIWLCHHLCSSKHQFILFVIIIHAQPNKFPYKSYQNSLHLFPWSPWSWGHPCSLTKPFVSVVTQAGPPFVEVIPVCPVIGLDIIGLDNCQIATRIQHRLTSMAASWKLLTVSVVNGHISYQTPAQLHWFSGHLRFAVSGDYDITMMGVTSAAKLNQGRTSLHLIHITNDTPALVCFLDHLVPFEYTDAHAI